MSVRVGDVDDRSMGIKEKEDIIRWDRKRADTVGGGGDRQMEGVKRKRMLFGRREEEQRQWVVGVTDKYRRQRERGCYSVGQRADMIIWMGKCTA